MFTLLELKKRTDGIAFEEQLDVKTTLLARDESILDVSDVMVKGQVRYDNGLYLLDYTIDYSITLPSSRSMLPVTLQKHVDVAEVFIEASEVSRQRELVEEELVLILEGDRIDLEESILDNILLNIPLKILTVEEAESDELPSGKDWSVLTESQYQAMKSAEKETSSPFATLVDFFKTEE